MLYGLSTFTFSHSSQLINSTNGSYLAIALRKRLRKATSQTNSGFNLKSEKISRYVYSEESLIRVLQYAKRKVCQKHGKVKKISELVKQPK